MKIIPVAFTYLDHSGNVCYTGNLEGPYTELQAMSRYGRKGAILPLITEQQHRVYIITLLGKLKTLSNVNPIEASALIDKIIKENMR